jgi:two-component system response regulator TctD
MPRAVPSTTTVSRWTCRRALLRALLVRPGQAAAKDKLFSLVFADAADAQPDAIEVVAYRLRKRLAGTGAKLVTLRGLGYLLQADD